MKSEYADKFNLKNPKYKTPRQYVQWCLLFRADKQTDGQDETNSRFSHQFYEFPQWDVVYFTPKSYPVGNLKPHTQLIIIHVNRHK
jgi:hypothetical protein